MRHDRFIRKMMANPRVSKQFMQAHLPQLVLDRIDINSIKLDNCSFVDDKLRDYISDIVLTGKFDGKPGYISLVVEHLSGNDKLMPLRMIEYIASAYRYHIKQNGKGGLWPVIFPVVVTNINGRITMKHSLADLTICPEIMSEVMRNIHLVDLSKLDDQDLAQRAWSAMLEIIINRRGAELLIDILTRYRPLIEEAASQDLDEIMSCLKSMICYNEDITQKSDKDKLNKLLSGVLGEERSKNIMETLGDAWRSEGIAQGLSQGMEQGLSQGEHNKAMLVAQNMLADGESVDKISKYTGLSIEEINKMKPE